MARDRNGIVNGEHRPGNGEPDFKGFVGQPVSDASHRPKPEELSLSDIKELLKRSDFKFYFEALVAADKLTRETFEAFYEAALADELDELPELWDLFQLAQDERVEASRKLRAICDADAWLIGDVSASQEAMRKMEATELQTAA